MPEDDTAALRLEQLQRSAREREAAEEAPAPAEERAHERRADRAAYLAEKLADRERSEREA
jgi:hypothetical protein